MAALLKNKLSTVLFLASIGLGSITIPLFFSWIINNKNLRVERIEILGCNKSVNLEVKNYLNKFYHKPIYDIKLDDIAFDLLKQSNIKSAVIRRKIPDLLQVEIGERTAVAMLQNKNIFFVDESGKIFAATHRLEDIPVIKGINVNEGNLKNVTLALREHKQANSPGGKITEININRISGLTFIFINGLRVELGNDNFLLKWNRLTSILDASQRNSKEISIVRLVGDSRMHKFAVRFREGTGNGSIEAR